MPPQPTTEPTLRAEIAELRARLEEAEETLRAIRAGEVDALVVQGAAGSQIFTLQGLDAEQNRLRGAMLAQVSDAVVTTDRENRVTFLNPAAEQQYRVRSAEVLGQKVIELYTRHWPSPEAEAAALSALEERGHWRGEKLHRTRDGRELPVEASIAILHDPETGQRAGLIVAIRDITQRKEAEAAQLRNTELFSKIIEQAPGGVYVVDAQFRLQHVNAEALPVFASVQPLAGRDFDEVMEIVWGPEIGPQCASIFRHTLATGERYISPRFSEQRHDLGVEQTFEWETQRIILPDGQHGVVCYFQDITERERAAAALRLTNERFDLAVKCSQVVLFQQDLELRYTWLQNPTPGFDRPEAIGKRDPDLMERAEDAAAIEALKREVIRTGVGLRQEVQVRIAAVVRHYELLVEAQRDAAGLVTGLTGAAIEVTERKQAEAALRESEERIQQALRVSQSFTFDWSPETDRVRRSASAGAILRLPAGEAVTDTALAYFQRIHPEDRERFVALVTGLRADAPDYQVNYRVVCADGELVSLEEVARGSFDAGGKLVRLEGVATDVTRRKQAETVLLNEITERKHAEAQVRQLNNELAQRVAVRTKELEEKAAELELTSRYKSEFLANMSHELRTPLNSLLILSGALADNKPGNLSGQQVEWAKIIQGSGADLLKLINEVLDLSKIEAGKVEIEVADVTLASVLAFNERTFRHMAEKQKLSFTLSLDPSLPASLDTDEYRLQQILKNLVANAFKFTSEGGVALEIAAATHGWGPDHERLNRAPRVIAFAVRDTGIGIAPDKRPMIFDAFRQAESGTARKYGGTGLGLAISRDLARLLGGTIRVASEPGVGSTFTLYLPDDSVPTRLPDENALFLPRAAASPQAVPAEHDASNEILHGCKVLIVDDDARNIFALTSLLENHEMNVLTATGGRAAIDIVKKTPGLGLILMDIMMPEMDGYETIREIRSDPEFRSLPILALTAKAMKGDREKCLDAGASDYIAKPVNTGQLLSMMRQCLLR